MTKARRTRKLKLPSPADHARAIKAMAPYIDAFQAAADEETIKDFGMIPGRTTKQVGPTPRKRLKKQAPKRSGS